MHKMLIIDDSQLDRELLRGIYQEHFDVTVTANPNEYIKLVNDKYYDIVLVDYIMPNMNGLDFIKLINPSKENVFPPIIMCSSDSNQNTQIEAYRLGVSDYFIKPYNPDNLVLRALKLVIHYIDEKRQMEYESSVKKGLQLLLSDLPEKDIMERICEGINKAYNANCTRIFFKENDKFISRYKCQFEQNASYDKLINITISDISLVYDAAKENKLIAISDVEVLKDKDIFAYQICKGNNITSFCLAPITNNDEVIGFISIANYDISLKQIPEITLTLCLAIGSYYKRKEYENQLEFDSLTGLYRKQPFEIKLRKFLDDNPSENYSLILMDVSNFKVINTFYGFEQGDKLLKIIADSLKRDTKKIKLLSRIENDKFMFLISSVSTNKFEDHVDAVRKYLLSQISIKNIRLNYGIYNIENHSEDVEMMISKATFANNQNRDNPNSKYVVYKDDSVTQVLEEQKMFEDFEVALANNEFVFYIQPKFDLVTNDYCGGEALARWVKRDGTLIPPDKFVPVFEKTGIIRYLDNYLFESLCKEIRTWIDKGQRVLPISINVSRSDFLDGDIYDTMINTIEKYHVPHDLIEIEITESIYATNTDVIAEFCKKMINEAHIKILMDDFGSGYSSLNTLKDLDISILKVDYKFLSKTPNVDKRIKIIVSVCEMAKRLGLPVVAEGVETIDDVLFLKKIGVKYIQGYYYGKPMNKDLFNRLINEKSNK